MARSRVGLARYGETLDVHAEDDALKKSRDRRPNAKRSAPPLTMLGHLQAELERNAAEDQAQQHQQNRKVQRRDDDRERRREHREQYNAAQDEPRFVAVPDRRHRAHHQRTRVLVPDEGKENADTEIETVEEHVHEDADAENDGPNGDEIELHRDSSLYVGSGERARRALGELGVAKLDIARRSGA